MWALVTELLFSFVLLAFLVISGQNVMHIASGSLRSVLTYVHAALDRELGEAEGMADEEENVTTRVVRRRVILKVPNREGRGERMRERIDWQWNKIMKESVTNSVVESRWLQCACA